MKPDMGGFIYFSPPRTVSWHQSLHLQPNHPCFFSVTWPWECHAGHTNRWRTRRWGRKVWRPCVSPEALKVAREGKHLSLCLMKFITQIKKFYFFGEWESYLENNLLSRYLLAKLSLEAPVLIACIAALNKLGSENPSCFLMIEWTRGSISSTKLSGMPILNC